MKNSKIMGGAMRLSLIAVLSLNLLIAEDLGEIVVTAKSPIDSNITVSQSNENLGTRVLNRKTMDTMPTGNSDVTSLLKTNPAVQFSNKNNNSMKPGDLDPAELSINGAKFYQNKYMIDGISINNDIDPIARDDQDWEVAGKASSFGLNLDSDLVEILEVHDSDISAQYGNFQGGVVNAKTRDPRKGFHGKFSISHTEDSWTKRHIDSYFYDDERNGGLYSFDRPSWYQAKYLRQPEFSKWTTRLNLEGDINDNFALLMAYTYNLSIMPEYKLTKGKGEGTQLDGAKFDQKNKNHSLYLKGVWYDDNGRWKITPSFLYAPQTDSTSTGTGLDDEYKQRVGGYTADLTSEYFGDTVDIKNQFNYVVVENSRDSNNPDRWEWQSSDVFWWGDTAAVIGGGRNYEQKQKTFTDNLDFDFKEFDLGFTSHQIKAGLELKLQDAEFAYKKDSIYYRSDGSYSNLNGAACDPGDPLCSQDSSFGGNGQYIYSRTGYKKGKISVDTKSYGAYLQDNISFGDHFKFRAGLRLDYNDVLKNYDLAPRLTASYDLFADQQTIISAGYNRYYGRNMFSYLLESGKNSLSSSCDRYSYGDTWSCTDGVEYFNGSELDTPYDDEFSVALRQRFLDDSFEFGAKYIKRKGKNGIMYSDVDPRLPVIDARQYLYFNGGKSDSDIVNLSLKTLKPIEVANTLNTFELAMQYLDEESNFSDYGTFYRPFGSKIGIWEYRYYHNGEPVNLGELPKSNFEEPLKIVLATVTQVPSFGLTWSNFFTYKKSYKRTTLHHTDTDISFGAGGLSASLSQYYEDARIPSTFTWDTKFHYETAIKNDLKAFVNLDIYNVLNKKNKVSVTYYTDYSNGENTVVYNYGTGRQFWLEAGIKW